MLSDLCNISVSNPSIATLDEFGKLVETGEIRDLDFECASATEGKKACSCNNCIYSAARKVMQSCRALNYLNELKVWKLIFRLTAIPEFDNDYFLQMFSDLFVDELISFSTSAAKFDESQSNPEEMIKAWGECISYSKLFIHYLYRYRFDLRESIRLALIESLNSKLTQLSNHSSKVSGRSKLGNSMLLREVVVIHSVGQSVGAMLDLIGAIVSGFKAENTENDGVQRDSIVRLVQDVLMPLHSPNEMEDWRDQSPLIKIYHEQLVLCLSKCVAADRQLSDHLNNESSVFIIIIKDLLKQWPQGFNANTPKEILFIHELEMLLPLALDDEFKMLLPTVLSRIKSCILHDNTIPVQRALMLFKSNKIVTLCSKSLPEVLKWLLPVLYRKGELFWNPSVNKMTCTVLSEFQKLDSELFTEVANQVIQVRNAMSASDEKVLPPPLPVSSAISASEDQLPVPQQTMKGGMPPVRQVTAPIIQNGPPSVQLPKRQPFMPYTTLPQSSGPVSISNPYMRKPGKGGVMPAEITGVAPWAINRNSDAKSSSIPLSEEKNYGQFDRTKDSKFNMHNDDIKGVDLLLNYMERCKKSGNAGLDDSGGRAWVDIQAAATPTLLPSLRFHDLVFGQELGTGSFSAVKYARQIVREKTRNLWPEYAVKIVNFKVLNRQEENPFIDVMGGQEEGITTKPPTDYTLSITREIAILQVLCHPGIARLISCFSYSNSAYLVLEYASRGDLHTYLTATRRSHTTSLAHGVHGLTLLQTRFIIGEVMAALHYLHSHNFVYGDLKPENIVITELGHLKITDFGSCRPINKNGVETLRSSWKFLSELRDGDWRADYGKMSVVDSKGDDRDAVLIQIEALLEDQFAEGTLSYLPPEILMNMGESRPDIMSDCWALGCVAYFCIVGKPLFFGDSVQDILYQQRHVGFNTSNHKIKFEEEKVSVFTSDMIHAIANDDAVSFVCSLIAPLTERFSLEEALDSEFITKDDGHVEMVPLKLHFASPIVVLPAVDSVSNGADSSGWARRQLSSIWAPMPKSYDMDSGSTVQDTTSTVTLSSRGNRTDSSKVLPMHVLYGLNINSATLPAIVLTDQDKGYKFW